MCVFIYTLKHNVSKTRVCVYIYIHVLVYHWHNRGKALLHFFTASSTFFVVPKWLVIGAHNEQTQAAVPEGRVRLAKIDLSPDSVGNDLHFFIHFHRFQHLPCSTQMASYGTPTLSQARDQW
jgi:hypothetical protein